MTTEAALAYWYRSGECTAFACRQQPAQMQAFEKAFRSLPGSGRPNGVLPASRRPDEQFAVLRFQNHGFYWVFRRRFSKARLFGNRPLPPCDLGYPADGRLWRGTANDVSSPVINSRKPSFQNAPTPSSLPETDSPRKS